VLSSQDQDGISRLCDSYKAYLPSMSDPLYDLSYTLANKRSRLTWRAAIVASSAKELEDTLSKGQQATRAATEPGLGFVFTGQGAQWAQMGRGLMHYPPYRQSLESADVYLRKIGCEWSVIGEFISNSQY